MATPSIELARGWIGRKMVDRDYNTIGRVVDIYLDNETGRPEWAVVRTGLLGLRSSFVPLSFPFQTAIFDYGAGAQVGSTFTAKFVGLFGHVPGVIASDAGQLVLTGGVVTGFDENGIPLLDFETAEVLVEHGNFENQEDVQAAICGTLTA